MAAPTQPNSERISWIVPPQGDERRQADDHEHADVDIIHDPNSTLLHPDYRPLSPLAPSFYCSDLLRATLCERLLARAQGTHLAEQPVDQILQVTRSPAIRRRPARDPCPRHCGGAAAARGGSRAWPASCSRRSACATGRTSPRKPISPNTTMSAGTGRSLSAETSAGATARSAAGSPIRKPAGDVQVDFVAGKGEAAAGLQHRQDHGEAVASQPTTARRGVPSGEGATSAWISTSTGRVPSMPAKTAAPADAAAPLGEEQGGRVGDLVQAAVGHLEHADLVGRAEAVLDRAQDAELVAALALEIEHGVDHVLEHARAGDQAFLGDVADQHDREAAPLGEADQLGRAAAHLATVPGAQSSVSRYIVWIESITTRSGGVAAVEAGEDVAHVGGRGELHRVRLQAQAARRAAAPDRSLPRRRCRRSAAAWRRSRRAAPPAAAGSICRCRDRRRPGSASRAPARRRSPGRTRRCRSSAAGVRRLAVERRSNSTALALAAPRPFGSAYRAAASSTMAVPGAAGLAPAHPAREAAPQLWQTILRWSISPSARSGHAAATWQPLERSHLHLDRPLGAAVHELVDIGVAGMIDIAGSARAR